MRRRVLTGVATAATVLLLGAACGSGMAGPATPGPGGSGRADPTAAEERELTVFAAASLRTVLDEVGADFEDAHPGAEVTFSFTGSADLVAQLAAGAPADVLVTANRTTMDRAVEGGTVPGEPTVVASNVPALVTGPGNPLGIASLADAAAPSVDLVTCAPQVPCGAAARSVADEAGVELVPVSEENSVTDVLGKVTSGQAEAGIVYATDAAEAGEAVSEIALPGAEAGRTEYPAAVATEAEDPELASRFVEFLGEDAAQRHLADAGFRAP